jgi:type I restriction enzyme S subunit
MKVLIPSVSEQVEIVTFCNHQKSKYDLLINNTESALNLLQERRTALISAAVTGKIDVRDWEVSAVIDEGRN